MHKHFPLVTLVIPFGKCRMRKKYSEICAETCICFSFIDDTQTFSGERIAVSFSLFNVFNALCLVAKKPKHFLIHMQHVGVLHHNSSLFLPTALTLREVNLNEPVGGSMYPHKKFLFYTL